MRKGKFVVYLLVDPRDGEIRYVGSTINPKGRFVGHVHDTATNVKRKWINELATVNMMPVFEPLVYCTSAKQAIRQERLWIHRLALAGCPLTNCNRPRRCQERSATRGRIMVVSRFTKEEYSKIEAMAEREKRSIGNQVVFMVKEQFNGQKIY